MAAPRDVSTPERRSERPSRNIGTPSIVRIAAELLRFGNSVFRVCLNIGNMHDLALEQRPSGCRPTLRNDRYESSTYSVNSSEKP